MNLRKKWVQKNRHWVERLKEVVSSRFAYAIYLLIVSQIFVGCSGGIHPTSWGDDLQNAAQSVRVKLDRLHHAENQNQRLITENARLRTRLESDRFECVFRTASDTTNSYSLRLSDETGSRIGRVLAGINYRVPQRLTPIQLYTLGIKYLKESDFERVAVIFSTLTGLQDYDRFKTIRNYLITAIAWYRLDNYNLSNYYLDKILDDPSTASEALPYKAHARLWKALVARSLGQTRLSQKWLTELVDHHTFSKEVDLVNEHPMSSESHEAPSDQGHRKMASESKNEHQSIKSHSQEENHDDSHSGDHAFSHDEHESAKEGHGYGHH